MSSETNAQNSPVDGPQAGRPLDWSGHSPSERRSEPVQVVPALWFAPVKKNARSRHSEVVAWAFFCPFCDHDESHDYYGETYAAAYRHLQACEWRDPSGLRYGDH